MLKLHTIKKIRSLTLHGISLTGVYLTLALLMLMMVSTPAFAGSASLTWDANSEPDLAGYRVSYGTISGTYASQIDVGNVTSHAISSLADGSTYYFSVQAYDDAGNLSAHSREVSTVIGTPGGDVTPPQLSAIWTLDATTMVAKFSEPLDPASAESTATYRIDGAIAPLSATLQTDGKSVTLTTFTQVNGDGHTLTIQDLMDLNGNALNTTVAYTVDIPVDVSGIIPDGYVLGPVQSGDLAYVDTGAVVLNIPPAYMGGTWIRTADADWNRTDATWMSFDIAEESIVYVAYDEESGTPPDWLTDSFIPVGDGPLTSNSAIKLSMWAANYPAGTVTLGANMALGATGTPHNHMVLIKRLPDLAPAMDTDNSRMADDWETIYSLPAGAATLDDPDGDGLTNLQESWLGTDPLTTNLPSPSGNQPPVVDIPLSLVGVAGQLSGMDATDAFDPEGNQVFCQWVQVAGTPVVIQGSNTGLASVTPSAEGLYGFRVTVRDNQRGLTVRTVIVEVMETVHGSAFTTPGFGLTVESALGNGTQVQLPADALPGIHEVGVGSGPLPVPLPNGWVLESDPVYIAPSQALLQAPATVRIAYQSGLFSSNQAHLLRYDRERAEWQEVSGVSQSASALVANVDRLGVFVVVGSTTATSGVPGDATGGGCSATGGGKAGDAFVLLLLLAFATARRMRMAARAG